MTMIVIVYRYDITIIITTLLIELMIRFNLELNVQ